MPLNIARFEYQHKTLWGVVRDDALLPIPGEYPTTGDLIRGSRIDQLRALGGETVPLYARRSVSSTVLARLEPGVLGSVLGCDGTWCNLSLDSVAGWIQQVKLWGVYQNEEIE